MARFDQNPTMEAGLDPAYHTILGVSDPPFDPGPVLTTQCHGLFAKHVPPLNRLSIFFAQRWLHHNGSAGEFIKDGISSGVSTTS